MERTRIDGERIMSKWWTRDDEGVAELAAFQSTTHPSPFADYAIA